MQHEANDRSSSIVGQPTGPLRSSIRPKKNLKFQKYQLHHPRDDKKGNKGSYYQRETMNQLNFIYAFMAHYLQQ